MSAKNWTACPRCKATAARTAAAAMEEARAKYGTVSPDEYERVLCEAKLVARLAENAVADRDTLREDYQLGVGEDGVFEVSYRAECSKCPFTFAYQHRESVPAGG